MLWRRVGVGGSKYLWNVDTKWFSLPNVTVFTNQADTSSIENSVGPWALLDMVGRRKDLNATTGNWIPVVQSVFSHFTLEVKLSPPLPNISPRDVTFFAVLISRNFVVQNDFPFFEIVRWVFRSVYRLTMDWTLRGSNLGGGAIFRTRPGRPWGPPSLLHNGCRVFPGVKRPGLTTHPLLAPRSREDRTIPLSTL
jgi:hypothetical protein